MAQVTSIHYLIDGFVRNRSNLMEINILLERDNSCVNEKHEDWPGHTPLLRVLKSKNCLIEIVKLLLDYGADINCKDDDISETPLHVALLSNKDEAIISLLLENGADVNCRNDFGMTPFCYALQSGYSVNFLRQLLNAGCDPNRCGAHASSLYCARILKDNILDLLIGAGVDLFRFADDGQSPVCSVLRAGSPLSEIKRLLNLGASLDACSKHGSLWLCATDFEEEVYMNRRLSNKIWGFPLKFDLIELFRSTGVSPVDRVNEAGYTSLQLALKCSKYDEAAIECMFNQPGVDVSVKDGRNNNLLHLACENYYCKESVVKHLIDRGVKADEVNWRGETPLLVGIDKCDFNVVDLLLKSGSRVNAEAFLARTALRIAVISKRGLGIIELLLYAGARISFSNNPNETSALWHAFDDFFTKKKQKRLDILKLLLKHNFLENPCFDIEKSVFRRKIDGSKLCTDLRDFVSRCSREVRLIMTKDVLRRHLSSETGVANSSLSREDFNRLLNLLSKNAFPEYFEIIAAKVGKSEMKTKLQEIQVYSIKRRDSSSSEEKISLNYDSVCKIITFLSVTDVLQLILAFYVPDNHIDRNHIARNNEDKSEGKQGHFEVNAKRQKLDK